jgi:ribose 5-phosphate isomerase A
LDPKDAAARKAVEYVRDGMTIGLGTGSTSTYFIRALGEKMRQSDWTVRGVPTSERSRALAHDLGITIVDLPEKGKLDLAVDGADEADRALNLVKGGGGALLREKLVAAQAHEFIVICDHSKFKEKLGAFPLPVAVVPFAWRSTAARLSRYGAGLRLRQAADAEGQPFVSDDGLYMIDMEFGTIEDPPALEREIKLTTGVVDVGLFVGLASRLILGFEDGHTEELLPTR